MKLTENVLVLSGSYFFGEGNMSTLGEVYGIRTSGGVILIDTGEPVSGPQVAKETLAYFGISEPITHVIVTHAHHDHCGGAKSLQAEGAKIIVSSEDAYTCKNGGVWGMYTPFDKEQAFPDFTPDIEVIGDSELEINGLNFEFIQIPGHTKGSMAIRLKTDRKTFLFTGDSLQPDGAAGFGSYSFGWEGDPHFSREEVVKSMMKLMKYETDMVLPGHGKVCLRNGTTILRRAAQTAFLTLR